MKISKTHPFEFMDEELRIFRYLCTPEDIEAFSSESQGVRSLNQSTDYMNYFRSTVSLDSDSSGSPRAYRTSQGDDCVEPGHSADA